MRRRQESARMSALRNYWAGLDSKRLRLAGAAMFLVALLLFLNSSPGTTWNLVGWVFDLIAISGLVFLQLHRRR
jgi:hypothetical protein